MKLVVIIPAFNEDKTVGKVINSIPKKIEAISEVEVVVIDDGSTDKTVDVALSSGATVFSHYQNRGVGSAFNSGIKIAMERGADIAVNIDADGQFDPKDIPSLIKPIVKKEADFVTCSRFKDSSYTPKMPKVKIWGNRQMAKFISYLSGARFYDVSCGFRAYSREAMMNLNLFGKFTYTQESFLDLVHKGFRVKEVPVLIRGEREHGKSKIANNLFYYAAKTFVIIMRTIRDYKPLRFFGFAGVSILVVGLGFDGFFLWHWLATRNTSPYKSFGLIGAFLIALAVIILVLALVADMLDRIRMNQEKILYYSKKRDYERKEKDLSHNRD